MSFESFFECVQAQNQIKKLAKKYKNKKIVMYGAGQYCRCLFEKYDLSELNIIAVADMSFARKENQAFYGKKCIDPCELKNLDFDIILISVLESKNIQNFLENDLLLNTKNSKVKIKPIIKDLSKSKKQSIWSKIYHNEECYFIDKKITRTYIFDKQIKKTITLLPPKLEYLEYHIVDHCNLNCKACSHFCNLSDKKFMNVEDIEKDLARLSTIFEGIDKIRILGGEPLLHPQVTEFMKITRKYFPNSSVRLVTNGILLSQMKEDFWETCRQNNIIIDFSKYPATHKIFPDLLDLCFKNGVSIRDGWAFAGDIHVANGFQAFHNPDGNSSPDKAYSKCIFICNILKDSKLYICSKAAYAEIYNEKFPTRKIAQGNGIDIYKYNGREIIELLKKPEKTCAWCAYEWQKKPWEQSKRDPDEWNAVESRSKNLLINK